MPAQKNFTKDEVYDAVSPDDFAAMLNPQRYLERSTAFDRIISATHDHFWDPLDKRYIDFDQPFDMDNDPIVDERFVTPLAIDYVSSRLTDPQERTRFINQYIGHAFSSILHGEQGALSLSASLCHVLKDQGAQEYAANQAREEARHVTAFALYIKARWRRPGPCSPALQGLLTEIVAAPEVYKKIVGMQLLVEGLAMGAFATFFKELHDPLGRQLLRLVMTDEAFHHKFGKIWADRTVPKLSPEEHAVIEDWALHCFKSLLFNLLSPTQNAPLYAEFGLDLEQVLVGYEVVFTDEVRRKRMQRDNDMFRVLAKTLLSAGIITERTRAFYAAYVDLAQLAAEPEDVAGGDIAREGIAFLRALHNLDGDPAALVV